LRSDPFLLSCKVTEIQGKQKLPGIVTEQEWRKLFKSGEIQEKDFAGYLYVLSDGGGKPTRICSLKASLRENSTAATAWASGETIYCADERRIEKCSVALGKAQTIYDAASKEQKPKARKGLHSLAWNPDRREFVGLEFVQEGPTASLVTVRFDSEGGNVRRDVAIPSVADAKQLSFFKTDNIGQSLVAVAALQKPDQSALFYGRLDAEEHKDIPMPAGERFVPACVMSGTAVVAFFNQKGRFLENLDRKQLPTMDDFSFQVVSLT
jgi:hypothetical protein